MIYDHTSLLGQGLGGRERERERELYKLSFFCIDVNFPYKKGGFNSVFRVSHVSAISQNNQLKITLMPKRHNLGWHILFSYKGYCWGSETIPPNMAFLTCCTEEAFKVSMTSLRLKFLCLPKIRPAKENNCSCSLSGHYRKDDQE